MKNKNASCFRVISRIFFLWLVAGVTLTAQTSNKDILLLRKKFIAQAMEVPVHDSRVEQLLQTFQPDSTWTGIDYTDLSREAFQNRRHLDNIEVLSRAYRKKDSKYRGNKKVKRVIDAALAYWIKHDFKSENWYSNEIATPTSLSKILLIMDEALTAEQIKGILPIAGRAHINATGARPSGDRIKIAGIQAQVALFCYDEPTVEKLIKVIEGEVKFSTARGMRYDYSFHHRTDWVNNTLHYGLNYATTFAEWADMVGETSYRFTETTINQLIDFYLDGICKQMVYGRVRDMGILNRDISRRGESKVHSVTIPRRLSNLSSYRRNELENIIRAREGKPFEKTSFARHYWLSDHFVYQSPNYYASVRMYSNRICNMEEPYNGEGFYNHFRGDGTNHIAVSGDEYKDIAPFFDWRKVPGATVLNRDEMPPEGQLQKWGLTPFVGAVTDGINGAAGFDFISPHEGLQAKKAWFFFEDAYICLGAGIHSPFNRIGAITTLNQCLLNSPVLYQEDGNRKTLKEDTEKNFTCRWVIHDNIGYYFPEPENVTLANRKITGSFSDISRQASASKEKETKEIFRLWINHKMPTRRETYCYIVIPGMDENKMETWMDNNPLRVLSTTSTLQAVYSAANDLAYGIFYQGGTLQVEGKPMIEVDQQGMLLVQYEGNKITSVTVSSPDHQLSRFHLAIPHPVTASTGNCRVVWDEVQQKSLVSIDLPQGQFAGKSVKVNL